jgi:hypothetical protein
MGRLCGKWASEEGGPHISSYIPGLPLADLTATIIDHGLGQLPRRASESRVRSN